MNEIISKEIETNLNSLLEKFKKEYDFTQLEKGVQELLNKFMAPLLQEAINELMYNAVFLSLLKVLAGRRCLKYNEHRLLNVTILDGLSILVYSPYFYREPTKKRGKKKKGRKKGNNRYCHLGLSVIGFTGYYSLNLANEIVRMALLCPSLESCHKILKDKGCHVDVKTIRRLCREFGEIGISNRGFISATGHELIKGKTLVFGIDGGRLRERRVKRGRKKNGDKQQGFHPDWKEPKLFTIYLLNEKGEIDKDFTPFHDATMQGKDVVFDILDSYIEALKTENVAKFVFVGDGAPWIWTRVEELVKRTLPPGAQVHQVLDYTHAKQALGDIWKLLPKKFNTNTKLWEQWTSNLWEGDLNSIEDSFQSLLKGKKLTNAVQKFKNYFRKNEKRMKYKYFKEQGVPCGSGCVESAIRRVINMRLKSAGTFWLIEMAECFLFLRSQLISGRWSVFITNMKNIISDSQQDMNKKDICANYNKKEFQDAA